MGAQPLHREEKRGVAQGEAEQAGEHQRADRRGRGCRARAASWPRTEAVAPSKTAAMVFLPKLTVIAPCSAIGLRKRATATAQQKARAQAGELAAAGERRALEGQLASSAVIR